jgi:hypothetical protein
MSASCNSRDLAFDLPAEPGVAGTPLGDLTLPPDLVARPILPIGDFRGGAEGP